MKIKGVVGGSILAVLTIGAAVAHADTISGTAGAAFQNWGTADLNQNGAPYWDNTSYDGTNMNVGFFLVNAPTAPLAGAPGPLPSWGNTFNSAGDTGGSPDLNFMFNRTFTSSQASLQLEVAANSNLNEFGWYTIGDPADLHPIFGGAAGAGAST